MAPKTNTPSALRVKMEVMRRLLLLLLFVPAASWAEIQYTLRPDPAARSIRVSIHVEDPGQHPTLRIPAWCPGFYFLLKYQDKISDFRATTDDGAILTASHEDPRAWTVSNPDSKPITVSYSVLGDDPGLGFFAVNVLGHTAFINGPAAFMYLEGRKEEPTRLTIKNPIGWDTATAMTRDTDGTYTSGGYDELLDHPIQLGHFQRRTFEVEGIPYEAVFVSKNQQYAPDMDAEAQLLKTISAPPVKLFGGAAFKRYIYFLHLDVGNFGGGLEHRSCTVIALPNEKPLDLDTLAAHENFHAWNVKQIRPQALGPFDYTQPCRTGNLWWSEGVTDYYAYLDVYRSGLYDAQWLLDQFTGQIRELQSSRNRLKLTAEECSKKTWENGGFGVGDLSYYTKGLLIGFVLDSAIRNATAGQKSLDDVMRTLYARYRLPKPGFGEDDLRKTINEVAGKDLSSLYERLARSTQELPYEELSSIGLRVTPPNQPRRILGYSIKDQVVSGVSSHLYESGLREGDVLLEIGGKAFEPGSLYQLPAAYKATVRRGEDTLQLTLPVEWANSDQWILDLDPFPSAKSESLRNQFLTR